MVSVYGTLKRNYNGKTYRCYDYASSKEEANRLAGKRRKQGLLVRIVPLTSKYTAKRYGIFSASY